MSTFFFLCIMAAIGIVLWNIEKYPKVSTAGGWLLCISMAAILWGMHPNVPGILR